MKLKSTTLLLFLCCFALHTNAQQQTQDDAFNQAVKYQHGIGVLKDERKAFALYLESALGGNNQAMNRLAIFYKEGIGTVANKQLAIQWLLKSGEAGYARAFYNLGNIYKDAIGSEQDFGKAYQYFTKGADMKEPQSIYAKGYMLYKGFGCVQNYTAAVQYFKQGATAQLPGSMYFLGLCFRNGYGIAANKDSATYWLQKALLKGERMALLELRSSKPEHSNPALTSIAKGLKLKTVKPENGGFNKIQRITNHIEANIIEGKYRGYIVKYDWSNQYAISMTELDVEIKYSNNILSGTWSEEKSSSVPFQALITANNLLFKNTTYNRTGHYNPTVAMPYSFQNASIQWQKINDSITLHGTIQMFNTKINEPQKPQYIYLTKYESTNNLSSIELMNDDGSQMKNITNLSVYPNPFFKTIKVDFENKETQTVNISLVSTEGKTIYLNELGVLQPGAYSIEILPSQTTTPGVYILKMQFNHNTKSVKIVKQ